MKLNKRTILALTAVQSISMILVFTLFTFNSSGQLIISELLFFTFISIVSAFNINILFIVVYKMIKTVIDK